VRVDIWSDLVCPWCYIGKRRFEKALATFPDRNAVEVVHRSFQLDPSMPAGQLFRHRDVLKRKYGLNDQQVEASWERLEALAAAEGLEYHLAEGVTGNTLDAHRIVHLGAEQGRQDVAIERLFRAHFTDGRSLFNQESLAVLAEEAGLDGARELLASDRFAAEVASEHRQATELGARGVPFFVIDGRFGVSGAQDVNVFVQALARAHAQ
jgi:predicted DsbA family dithiol-disulfide isomerase